jgi:hypothetical protein
VTLSVTPGELPQLPGEAIADTPSAMGRLRRRFWTPAVSALCALALMLVAFAHRPVEAAPRLSDPQTAAYLALGGSLADLCLSGEDGQDHAAEAHCPACTLVKSMALAPTCPGPLGPTVWPGERLAWPETLAPTGHTPRAPPARGPPVIRSI